MAINKMLFLCSDEDCNTRVDVPVDNQAVIQAWNNQGGSSSQLNNAMKVLFSITVALNVLLHLSMSDLQKTQQMVILDTDLQRISALTIMSGQKFSGSFEVPRCRHLT